MRDYIEALAIFNGLSLAGAGAVWLCDLTPPVMDAALIVLASTLFASAAGVLGLTVVQAWKAVRK